MNSLDMSSPMHPLSPLNPATNLYGLYGDASSIGGVATSLYGGLGLNWMDMYVFGFMIGLFVGAFIAINRNLPKDKE